MMISLKKFRDQVNGSVAIMSALLMIPVIIAGGMAVDYNRGVSVKSDTQRATDAAALGLLKMEDATEAELTQEATDIVLANLDQGNRIAEINVTARRLENGDIEVDADMTIASLFMQLGGYNELDADVRSVASLTRNHLDVYLLVDRSASMLLAQDGANMTAMLNLTRPMIQGTSEEGGEPDGCGFACHEVGAWQTDGITLYDHAIANGIEFRSNAVADSAVAMARTLLQNPNRNVRVGVVDFSIDANIALAPSSDINAIEAALQTSTVDEKETLYRTMFDMMEASLTGQGDGSSAASARTVLVLITDGAYTSIYNDGARPNAITSVTHSGGTNYYEVFAPDECQALLDLEYEMIVINTMYDPLLNSGRYDGLLKPYASQIDGNLEQCATGAYFEATSTADIEDAFDELAEILGSTTARIKQ